MSIALDHVSSMADLKSAIVTLFQRLGFINMSPRGYSSMGVLGSVDGNIVGGLLQGVGMALAGSCPGTVFAQVGAGVKSGLYTLTGLVVGGVIWTGILQPYLQRQSNKAPGPAVPTSVDKRLRTSHLGAVCIIEAIFASIVTLAVSTSADKTRGLVTPVAGGFLIAGAQLLSALLRKTLLGTSTAFEEVGNCFWSVAKGGNTGGLPYKNIVFVSGMTLGAHLMALRYPIVGGGAMMDFDRVRVISGGVLLAIGSRMAGGCTSGHGISGISLLSVSSFITVASMFTGAIGTALAVSAN